jgi:hypothetical protein
MTSCDQKSGGISPKTVVSDIFRILRLYRKPNMMNKTKPSQFIITVILLVGAISLRAQGVLLEDFKAFNFFPNGVLADSIFYNPEQAMSGPQVYAADSLEVFSELGSFTLQYNPLSDSAYVSIWLDVDDDGQFEPDELIYRNIARNGTLSDTLNIPSFQNNRRALVAMSSNPDELSDPDKLLLNDQISSLQFMMISSSPKLTLGSKGDNTIREDSCVGTYLFGFELQNNFSGPCLEVVAWELSYQGTVISSLTAGEITQGGTPFGAGSILPNPDPTVPLDLDFSTLGLSVNSTYLLTCFSQVCGGDASVEMDTISFTTCETIVAAKDRQRPVPSLSVYPNPISASTSIAIELPYPAPVELEIFDLLGRRVDFIHREVMAGGSHRVEYTPQNLANGTYIISLKTPGSVVARKIVMHER